MAYVSVGQIENLEDAIVGLQLSYDSMVSACQTQILASEAKLGEVQKETDKSAELFEAACGSEQEAIHHLELSTDHLVSAESHLDYAYSSLSDCKDGGSYDEDNNYVKPDCSYERGELSSAKSDVTEIKYEIKVAKGALDSAKEHRMKMDQRSELARQCLDMAKQLSETVQTECAVRLASAATHIETGVARLESAKVNLNNYLNTHPPAAEFNSWLKYKVKLNTPISPKDLNSRLNLSDEQLRYYAEYLSDRDPVFRAKIADYRSQLDAANGSAEILAVQLKVRRNLSGYFGEKIVEQALSPLGNKVDTQARTTFSNGSFTKTDLVIEDLKVPVILGRGEGMSAPKGGSIAIEVKCGRASYLYSQKGHMVFQAGGHQKADASMTVCSRDIKNLTSEKEDEIRKSLKQSGSPLIGMLPSKDEIDKACWEIVTETRIDDGGEREN